MRDDLPSGTVTFLFTDVEGSTKLLHTLGAERYADALAEHRRVIREACAMEGGVEVDTQGDAFFFAFPTAPGALAAASAFTVALEGGSIRVRAGLHTGKPLLTEEGYVGDDVHFGARVASAGHGGQVILSAATAKLVEVELDDLGEHRLKDITEPVAIYQLGDGRFPPLKTISNTNLPRPASSFVGRERELEEVLARIEEGARLLTLTGPGGTGKTRLALEAASTLVPGYKAGVFWVGLAALRDPALVTETVSQTLGAKDGLAEHLGERELLLLLDNLEQVIEAAPELATLLERCPNLTLLVTSRELLRIRGEVEYPVPPLAEPEAVSLFCARSQLDQSDEIAELCARLDDLPLAVELAAARTKALTPGQILERLSQRLDLLKGGRDADPRQQTLRATIEWSYELLAPEEQRLFAAVSVFRGGCTLEAAEEVADADLDILQSLVEKSLLRFTPSDTGGRYWMLETIREYATAVMEAAGESAQLRQRAADCFQDLARRYADQPKVDRIWLDQLELDEDNMRATLEWLDETDQSGPLLELVANLISYWTFRGNARDGRRWADLALSWSDGQRGLRHARLLDAACNWAQFQADWDAARVYGESALTLVRELGDPAAIAEAHMSLGLLHAEVGDYAKSASSYETAIGFAQEAGDRRKVAIGLGNLADLAMKEGDYERGIELTAEALAIFRALQDAPATSWALHNLGLCLFRLERREEALVAARESLEHSVGDFDVLVWTFILLGAISMRRGDLLFAATLIGVVDRLVEHSGLQITGAELALLRETADSLPRALGEPAYSRAFSEGRKMTVEDAIQRALATLD